MGKSFGSRTAIFGALIAVLLVGLLFSGQIGGFFKGIFGGPSKPAPPAEAKPTEPVQKESPAKIVEKALQPGGISGISIFADEKFVPGKDRVTKINVVNDTGGEVKELLVFIISKGKIYDLLNGIPGVFKHVLKDQIQLKPGEGETIEWNGTAGGKFVPSDTYLIVASVKVENNLKAATQIIIYSADDTRNRAKLIEENRWPKELEVGVSPNKQLAVIGKPDAGQKKIFVVNEFSSETLGIEDKDFPITLAHEIVINGLPQTQLSNAEQKKIKVEVKDFEGDGSEYGSEPYGLIISLDYSEYFTQNMPLPEKEVFEISFSSPPFPTSPQINLKVNINESGAILYKKENSELFEFVQELAFKKGWELIGIENVAGLSEKARTKEAFLQPTLVVIDQTEEGPNPLKDSQQTILLAQKIREQITSAYDQRPFTHLLVIGNNDELPMLDNDGLPLDHTFYANVDSDAAAELSVGRLPLNVEQLKEYFAGFKETTDYSFFLGEGQAFERGYSNASQEENNRVLVREHFLYTGFSPVFNANVNAGSGEFLVFAQQEPIGGLQDFIAPHCPDFDHINQFEKFSSIVNPRYCVLESGGGVSFAQTRSANAVGFEKALSNQNGEPLEGNELLKELNEKIPFETFSLLVHERSASAESIGEAFRDYLNGTSLFYENTPTHYLLFGDPSNTIDTAKLKPNLEKKSFVEFGEKFITTNLPPLNLNELFFRDEPVFSATDLQNISQGKFATANAAIISEEFPFVTAIELSNPLAVGVTHSVELVKTGYSGESIILDEIGESAINEQKSFTQEKRLANLNYNKIVLKVKNSANTAEVLRGTTSWPKNPVPGEKTMPVTQGVNKQDYYYDRVILKHDDSIHANFLNATGKIENFSKNSSNVSNASNVSFDYIFENLPVITANQTKSMRDQKLLVFDYYELVLENDEQDEIVIAKLKPAVGTENKFFSKPVKVSVTNLPVKEGYDKIRLYGALESGTGLFANTPILTGTLANGELKNIFGFTQYPKAEAVVHLFYRKIPIYEGSKAAVYYPLYYEIEYKSVAPFTQGNNPVIVLESDNKKYQTNSMKAFAKKLQLEGKLKGINTDNAVVLNARPFLSF
ncbi:MAG: hypothetical protein HYW50_01745 [Candidatus Diapherotrites archaeon]|nr:hypothetical protein [Candidatus Diapherotrites archaeon]